MARLPRDGFSPPAIYSPSEPGVPDGMKCDAQGNVWVCGPGGVWVYAPDGALIGKLRVPELVGNLTWGGPDFRTLFLTATHSVYAVETKIGPRIEPYMRHATARSGAAPQAGASVGRNGTMKAAPGYTLDPSRCALIIQDMQNDVVMEGGAFAASGSPIHCREQNAIANASRLAAAARARGIPVIHVWFVVEAGCARRDDECAAVRGPCGCKRDGARKLGCRARAGPRGATGRPYRREERMSAWEGTRLETVLKALRRDIVIVTGAWTNMSIEHTSRTGADKGYYMVVPEDCCSTMNAEWHTASVNYALQNVAVVTDADALVGSWS